MGEVPYEASDTTYGVGRVINEPFAEALAERQLSLVRSRLAANLGASVASWFKIVPSACEPSGELRHVALLLDAHLPILVPVADSYEGSSFVIARYDVQGRRVEMSRFAEMSRFRSLGEALLASDMAFRELKLKRDVATASSAISKQSGFLPEEHWLGEQLRLVPANA